jgi:NADPH2:quinone reductase
MASSSDPWRNPLQQELDRMRAVVTTESGELVIGEVPYPEPEQHQLLVKTIAVSVNRGELLRAQAEKAGFRPGWDFSGIVVRQAAIGGPPVGSRVVGMRAIGAWAEYVRVPVTSVALVPPEVGLEEVSTLPIAGITALGAVDLGGPLIARKVLVTGASGGVGYFAAMLATIAGARVTAVVRRPAAECADLLAGVETIVSASSGLEAARSGGPYELVIDTLGGQTLSDAMTMLTPFGKCVTVGVTESSHSTIDVERFFMTGNATLQGLVAMRDLRGDGPGITLERLVHLLATGRLRAPVGKVADWEAIDEVARGLIDRSFIGKAVLRIGQED